LDHFILRGWRSSDFLSCHFALQADGRIFIADDVFVISHGKSIYKPFDEVID